MTNNQQAARELLPCPWCGGTIGGNVSEGSTFRWRKVDGCCADGPEIRHDTVADDQRAAEIDSTRRAIEAWNTRATPTPISEESPTPRMYALAASIRAIADELVTVRVTDKHCDKCGYFYKTACSCRPTPPDSGETST